MTRWVKVPNAAGNDRRKGHTCHAVGSQMMVLGGYPPGVGVDPTAPCDENLIKVFDLSHESVRPNGAFYMKYEAKGHDK